jgi:hypothetical protein
MIDFERELTIGEALRADISNAHPEVKEMTQRAACQIVAKLEEMGISPTMKISEIPSELRDRIAVILGI